MSALRIDGTRPLTEATIRAVNDFCAAVEDASGLAVVRVSGAARWANGPGTRLLTGWERALHRMERLPAPTVALATGDVGGVALDALLATDLRIAAVNARLFVGPDVMPLHRIARRARTIRAWVLSRGPVDAAAACAGGLIDEVTDAPEAALVALARTATGIAGQELAIRRQLLTDASRRSFEDALDSHLAACDRALRREVAS